MRYVMLAFSLLVAMVAPVQARAQATPIQHVVVIVQENRTVDNLFQGFPGADTQSYGYSGSTQVPLQRVNLDSACDIGHSHSDFLAAYASGAMNGWDGEYFSSSCPANYPYSYVPEGQLQPYWAMAQTYTFADETFQTNQGPSFAAHQYLLSATSAITNCNGHTCQTLKASENPVQGLGGCDSDQEARVQLIDQYGSESKSTFPCFSRFSIIDGIMAAGLTWHYYQSGDGGGLWHGPDALRSLCPQTPCNSNPNYAANVVTNPSQVLSDVASGYLANVTWVTPTPAESDHAGGNDGSGPDWVATVVNAIGESPYWDSTAIFIVWDDWGGWFDHAVPTIHNSYENGFRVPVIVISPYAKLAYVSHTNREVYGSLLRYTEETFGLPSLGFDDASADDFSDCFNYSQPPTQFAPIQTFYGASYFLSQPAPNSPPDEN